MSITTGISAALELTPFKGDKHDLADPTMSDVDSKQLSTEGFRCVRLVLSPAALSNGSADGAFDPKRVAALLSDIQTAEQSGLSVIVAPQLGRSDLANATVLLGRMASAIAKTDLESTFLEVCSDPMGMQPDAWQLVQQSWVDAIRKNLPRHTLIVRAPGADEPGDLTAMTPLTDRNVVYAFKFFEPSAFTDQCLPGSPIKEDDNVTLPYPGDLGAVAGAIRNLTDDQKEFAMRYAHEGWNADKILDVIHPVGDWARSHKVRVVCDGFGVSEKVSPTARSSYLQDVKAAISAAGVGWIVSEYVGPRGIFTGVPSLRTADQGILGALGMSG